MKKQIIVTVMSGTSFKDITDTLEAELGITFWRKERADLTMKIVLINMGVIEIGGEPVTVPFESARMTSTLTMQYFDDGRRVFTIEFSSFDTEMAEPVERPRIEEFREPVERVERRRRMW